jgi:cobalt-precorrin 5A hydrolase
MGLDKTMIVAGVGCRRGTPAVEIETIVRAALARAGVAAEALDAVATIAGKEDEAGLVAAVARLGVRVVFVSQAELAAADSQIETRSERVLALMGVPSVAEAAALAVTGPSGRLLGERCVAGAATCALATSDQEPEVTP